MLYILESFNKSYLQSAYLLAKSSGLENTLLYEFLNSAPNELKLALTKRKLTSHITQNEIEWTHEINLKTKTFTISAFDKINNVTYRTTFFKVDNNAIQNISKLGLPLGEFEIKTNENSSLTFLKQTREYVPIKPFLYEYTLHKNDADFLVETVNQTEYSFETRFDSKLYPIVNECEPN